MKKFSLLFMIAVIFASAQQVAAQFSISPNPVYKDGVMANDFEGVAYATITNETDQDLNLTWSRSVIEITEGWTSAVCDVIQCYIPSVSSQPFDLAAGASGAMDVHVYPNGFEGAAIIKVVINQTDDPFINTSATYYFNHAVGIAEKFSEAIKIYPNPTQDYISIDNTENLAVKADIYSVTGKLVLSSSLTGSERINVQELPAGNYILKLLDGNSQIVSTNLLVKQ